MEVDGSARKNAEGGGVDGKRRAGLNGPDALPAARIFEGNRGEQVRFSRHKNGL